MSGAKGEEWQAGVSTILQVLISIQAMILCVDPENNEPGFGYARNIGAPSAMTKSIRSLTIKYGIMSWSQNPPSLWKDIVEAHLRKQGDRIPQTAERWGRESRQDSQGPYDQSMMLIGGFGGSYGSKPLDIRKLLGDLQSGLKRYGTTYAMQGVGASNGQQQSRGGGTGYGDGGGRFGGSGGKGGVGTPGSRYGRSM
jgi:hypothetical protein